MAPKYYFLITRTKIDKKYGDYISNEIMTFLIEKKN